MKNRETTGAGSDISDPKAEQRTDKIWSQTSIQENIRVSEIRENAGMRILTESPADAEASEISGDVTNLLLQGDFAALDDMAEGFLTGKERLVNGGWKINAFYDSFDLSDGVPTKIWERRLKALETWKTENPKSQFSRIALAAFYVDYAWRARGSGYANTVSDEGWRLMGERLGLAGETAEIAFSEVEVTDPSIYHVATRIALGAELPPSTFDGFVAASLDLEPDFHHTLTARAYSLLPRWHGEPGDWEYFAKFIADENKPYGKQQYARIVLNLFAFRRETIDFEAIDWELFKESVREIQKNFPDALGEISNAAFLATLAQDRPFAQECFKMIGDQCLAPVWKVNGRMVHYRNWAMTGEW